MSIPSTNQQRVFIESQISISPKLGDDYCLLSFDWWKKLNSKFQNDSLELDPIDNSTLLSEATIGTEFAILKQSLAEGRDYVLVNEATWKSLVHWYGGGPKITRKVIKDTTHSNPNLKVDIFPVLLNTHLLNNNNKKKQFYFSKHSTLKDLLLFITSLTFLPPFHSSLFGYINNNWTLIYSPFSFENSHSFLNNNVNSKLEDTLQSVGIDQNGITIIATNSDCNHFDNLFPLFQFNDPSHMEVIENNNFYINSIIDKVDIDDLIDDNNSMEMPIDTNEESDEDEEQSAEQYYEKPSTVSSYSSTSSSRGGGGGGGGSRLNNKGNEGVCGLSNLGNTCFMNSTIQCLSNTILLKDYFVNDDYKKEINKDNAFGSGGKVAEEFAKVLKKMWDGIHSIVNPSELRWLIGKLNPQFLGHRQHDSQELLAFLLDGLHEDLNRVASSKVPSKGKGKYVDKRNQIKVEESEMKYIEIDEDLVNDVKIELNGNEINTNESWKRHIERKSIIVDLFQGQLKSTLVCPQCDNISITFDPFLYISMSIPTSKIYNRDYSTLDYYDQKQNNVYNNNNNVINLYDCLRLFVSKEKLGSNEKWYCPECSLHQEATKKIDIWRAPEILVFHLKRFRYNKHARNKIDSFVEFPLKNLDLTEYVLNNNNKTPDNSPNKIKVENQQPILYDLFAVSNHIGDTGGGHYTAFALNHVDGNWYLFNDSLSKSISPDSVCTSDAYVLFYQRVKDNMDTKQTNS